VHILGEAVSSPGHGDDVTMILRGLAERLAQHKDVAAEIGLLDKRIWPDSLHQVVFGDDLLAVADQDQKDLEGLGGQCDGHAGLEQGFSRRINPKRPELVELFYALVLADGH
jgi:hypothetical protein